MGCFFYKGIEELLSQYVYVKQIEDKRKEKFSLGFFPTLC